MRNDRQPFDAWNYETEAMGSDIVSMLGPMLNPEPDAEPATHIAELAAALGKHYTLTTDDREYLWTELAWLHLGMAWATYCTPELALSHIGEAMYFIQTYHLFEARKLAAAMQRHYMGTLTVGEAATALGDAVGKFADSTFAAFRGLFGK